VIGVASTGYQRPDLSPARPPTGNRAVGFVGAAEAGGAGNRAFAVVDGRDGVCEINGVLEQRQCR
jgi:hypothetical protein